MTSQVVPKFEIDYLTATSSKPSGYAASDPFSV
jgi:hypothetical protein